MRRYEDSKTWGGLLPCRSTPSAKRLKSSDNLCSPMNRTSISSANSRFSCTPLSKISFSPCSAAALPSYILGKRSFRRRKPTGRSEEHTSELQSLMRISYAVFCLKKKKNKKNITEINNKTIYRLHSNINIITT